MREFKERLKYQFDNLMSKGTISLVWVLFLATLVVVVVLGLISYLVSDGSVGDNIWSSLMHTIDAGTIAGDDTSNGLFIIVMSLVTLSGIFITSILIGIITTGFEEKLNDLKKGNSKVIEKDHTVILGFNESIYTIINELIIANENKKKPRIVILTKEEKETVENAIKEQIENTKNTKIICRTGNITDLHMLKQVSIDKAKSIIINSHEDITTIKSILVVNSFIKSMPEQEPYMVATINDKKNYDIAKIAGEENIEIVLAEEYISKIIAQACRQPGLSNVLVELFDYDGNELYFENFPELAGIEFKNVLNRFENAIVFGYKRKDEIVLNPKKNEKIKEDDLLILLVEDDNVAKPILKDIETLNISNYKATEKLKSTKENILILGENSRLERILLEIDEYAEKDSIVLVATSLKNINLSKIKENYKNIKLEIKECDISDRKILDSITNDKITQVLLLSNDNLSKEESDSKTLLNLINLRDIKEKNNYKFLVTSEMNESQNQKLAEVTKVNDLVIGSNIINLILTQISENRDLAQVFKMLLESEGSEIYTKKVANYIKFNKEIDIYSVSKICSEKNEIFIGYKKIVGDSFEIEINPSKSSKVIFDYNDELIVLAED